MTLSVTVISGKQFRPGMYRQVHEATYSKDVIQFKSTDTFDKMFAYASCEICLHMFWFCYGQHDENTYTSNTIFSMTQLKASIISSLLSDFTPLCL